MLIPINDRIVVQLIAASTKSPGGIIIPEVGKEKPTEARVVAVGPGRLLESGERATMQVKDGDRVLVARYSGEEFKHNNEDFVVLIEEDLLAIVR